MSSRLALELVLRPATDADRAFLASVYASTREAELDQVAWVSGQREEFLAQQFDAQDVYWREQRPHTERTVVVIDGEDAGRLYVDRGDTEIRVVDIALLDSFRGRGAGTLLLERLLDEGARRAVPVTIHVEVHNPARGLYDRLGFRPVSRSGVYDLLEWRAAA